MRTNFITPCPVAEDGTWAHACGPITWEPAEKKAAFEVFVVQEHGYARGTLRVNRSNEIWELHAHAEEGTMKPGPAVGFGVARVDMKSEHGQTTATVHWSDSVTLVVGS